MKKVLKEKVDAMEAFEKFCTENIDVWNTVTAFGTALTALRLKINSIYSTESRQEENNKGVTQTKAETKNELANAVVAVSNAMQAYALSIGNQTLFAQMSTCHSKIYYAKNENAISAAELVLDKAKSFPIVTLQPFGISAPVLDALSAVIDSFKAVAPSTRNVVTMKTVLTNNLKQLVKEGNVIMRKELLKMGRQFKTTHPNFYEGMVANAKVINKNIHAKIRLTVKDAITQAPLTGVLIEITGTALQGITDMQGKCTITNVGEGSHDVVLRKTNYDVYTLEDVDFSRGRSVTAIVQMQPAIELQPTVVIPTEDEMA